MRVAIDARTMQDRPLGGVGRALARVLPRIAERVEITLLTDAAMPRVAMELAEQPLRTPRPGYSFEWLQWSAPRWLADFDGVFHCPFYGLPVRQPAPMVVTIYDLSFEHFRGWMPATQRALFRAQARWAARTARLVLTSSRHVADDLAVTYGIPVDRVMVSPIAADPIFRPDHDPGSVLDRLGVRQPYAVAIGGAARRRLDVALAAWRAVRERGMSMDLVVVGTAAIPAEPGLAAGRLADGEWAAVLSGASALLYPTAYEGFGLPALEAAASGTPVVCARVGALPEVLGEAAAWCDNATPTAVAEVLARIVDDPFWAAELRAAGLERAAAVPGPEVAAEIHLAAYEAAQR